MFQAMLPVIFLCWGSFLNVLGYRLIIGQSIIHPRSQCPHCTHALAWYDLIPVASWCILRGRCRSCAGAISWLYPFIELLTPLLLITLYTAVPLSYFFSYFVFFSALIVTIRSDIETMLISQYVTLFLIPVAFIFAGIHLLPITIEESILGALFGYAALYIPAKIFLSITGKDGLGQGDVELLACIGAFLGASGVWICLLISSLVGSLFSIAYLAICKADRTVKIPFGPFLALGAIVAVLYPDFLLLLF